MNEFNFIRIPSGCHVTVIGDFLDVGEIMKTYVKKEENSHLAEINKESAAPAPDRDSSSTRDE